MKNIKIWVQSLLVIGSISILASCTPSSNHAIPSTAKESSTSQTTTTSTVSTTTSTTQSSTSKSSSTTTSSSKPKSVSSSTKTLQQNKANVLAKLVTYTNQRSAGPTSDYYYTNGRAKLGDFSTLAKGEARFSSDAKGRSGIAKAILTYQLFSDSRGSRQGTPLDPPAWPSDNPKVAISYSLTGRVYHGYLYNRSHSIADSLLGEQSYASEYNFTTGTRSQNVGSDQNGGMRYAEELAEDYWNAHPESGNVLYYQTTPLYKGNETMPRGSLVDIKSSDGSLDVEVVVINSAEGIALNYNLPGAVKSNASTTTTTKKKTIPKTSTTGGSYQVSGGWSTAQTGYVFVNKKSNKYYRQVTNPDNYNYMTQSAAISSGAVQAKRGNAYAKP